MLVRDTAVAGDRNRSDDCKRSSAEHSQPVARHEWLSDCDLRNGDGGVLEGDQGHEVTDRGWEDVPELWSNDRKTSSVADSRSVRRRHRQF